MRADPSGRAVFPSDKFDLPLTRTAETRPLRVLIASHSHPEVSNGGAEIAAYQLYQALRQRPDSKTYFLGCDRTASADRPGAVLSQPFGDDEYVYCTGALDWFKFSNPDPRFRGEIERLFIELAPDVVHFHHYINFGVEVSSTSSGCARPAASC